MGSTPLAKAFNPSDFEDRIYAMWEENGYFSPVDSDEAPFVIVIPPPNVTGILHMGHGLNNSLQDILIRYYRMTGVPALWVPGTDHAGIATQNVVERQLRAKGQSRHDLGREAFVEETWKVAKEHLSIIDRQLKKIGSSCDWSRERFTLDEGLSSAVRQVFVTLYERDMIYRGNYLVNWCCSCGTALSDDEVEHQEQSGWMYRYYYPLEDGSGQIEIATTRPETMFGDTAVAVHPDDERYQHLIGRNVKLPLTDRIIPIIADTYVDREFGSGAVKITPAHDSNDYDIGIRHNLDRINVLTPEGRLNDRVPEKYAGSTPLEARELVIQDLKDAGLFISQTGHVHQVGHCYRCDTVIEPFLSEQWFVRMKGMAQKALAAWERDEIRFYPKRWENTYKHWLNGIRDWCISRQLWWGHRIPVWYCDDCGETIVRKDDPLKCPGCGSEKIRQDEDVLDTWFSSWLWPFSTLGWPDTTDDLKRFYPTSALVTGYDIIFFWVARMIMAGLEFMGTVPFRDIYITGLVRDKQGRKMSKSLGNGLDPLEIVDEFGADAHKFTLAFLAAQGQDILIDKESFKVGSKFANKIWNAARFLLMNMDDRDIQPLDSLTFDDMDTWIYHRLNLTVQQVRAALTLYRFNDASQGVYEFFWNDFCDWYIEASKLSLYSDSEGEKNRIVSILAALLEETMRLLHPFLPFITEEIYQKLPNTGEALIIAPYPVVNDQRDNLENAQGVEKVQEMIRGVRTFRSEFTIPPERKIPVHIRLDRDLPESGYFIRMEKLIAQLTNASALSISTEKNGQSGAVPVAGNGFETFIFVRDVIDVAAEVKKLEKEQGQMQKLLHGTAGKLKNVKFLEQAPQEVIEKEKAKMAEFEARISRISRYLKDLGSV